MSWPSGLHRVLLLSPRAGADLCHLSEGVPITRESRQCGGPATLGQRRGPRRPQVSPDTSRKRLQRQM